MAGIRYLITGANGYIGQNVVNLIDSKFSLCDKHTSLPPAERLTEDLVRNVDGVIHLAALSGIFACEENPWGAVRDNVSAAGNVFNIAYKLGIPVVFTSSQAAKTPHTSFYANMKFTCETLADYFNKNGAKIYVVRLSNVYGGLDYISRKNTCVKQFITKYHNNEPFEIHGDGKQKRDFVHCFDVVEAIKRIITTQPDYYKPIDIGTGIGTSIVDLANMFPRKRNEHAVYTDSRNAGARSSVADISVLEKLTGFKPEREIEDYIKEMI